MTTSSSVVGVVRRRRGCDVVVGLVVVVALVVAALLVVDEVAGGRVVGGLAVWVVREVGGPSVDAVDGRTSVVVVSVEVGLTVPLVTDVPGSSSVVSVELAESVDPVEGAVSVVSEVG